MARTNRDSRRKRQDWATNPVITGGSAALMQAVAPVLDWARWQKNVINKFDDKGRPDHKVEWVDFQCIITPMERSRSATAGGDRSTQHFNVMYLKPSTLQIGDILVHRTFGMMKIESFNGLTDLGLTSARAIGLNAGQDIEDGEAIRNEQPDIL